ncbi:hypothetical protein CWI38_1000p0010 [Hamiltosporidium tvaerminnensis]|uniref:Uncharacterized protein n=1 Tax=Hamiltosporidium tvaerminnensis TaxID=1176355 RepID=A0A4Q9LW20_9MICR|nr:hypothetical protein CWI38_1000p0010 [Hamiltosporidium tvaerminnensis]
MTWDGIVTKYHKSHLKRLEILMNVEAYIQSIVLKKTVETISFDRRRGIESEPNVEESYERASLSVIIGAEMHEEPTLSLKEEKREDYGGTTLEEPTNTINEDSDLEEETKVFGSDSFNDKCALENLDSKCIGTVQSNAMRSIEENFHDENFISNKAVQYSQTLNSENSMDYSFRFNKTTQGAEIDQNSIFNSENYQNYYNNKSDSDMEFMEEDDNIVRETINSSALNEKYNFEMPGFDCIAKNNSSLVFEYPGKFEIRSKYFDRKFESNTHSYKLYVAEITRNGVDFQTFRIFLTVLRFGCNPISFGLQKEQLMDFVELFIDLYCYSESIIILNIFKCLFPLLVLYKYEMFDNEIIRLNQIKFSMKKKTEMYLWLLSIYQIDGIRVSYDNIYSECIDSDFASNFLCKTAYSVDTEPVCLDFMPFNVFIPKEDLNIKYIELERINISSKMLLLIKDCSNLESLILVKCVFPVNFIASVYIYENFKNLKIFRYVGFPLYISQFKNLIFKNLVALDLSCSFFQIYMIVSLFFIFESNTLFKRREERGRWCKKFKPKNKAPLISQEGTTLEEPTNNINKESDLEEETKVVKEVEENK